jgi:pimeloyl-ACP methyl ester carboxylesterase
MNTISGQGADPALPVTAVQPFPAGFRTQDIQVKGVALYVRIGGEGSAVVLLHGYGETGDMWAPLAAELARDHTVIAPDLRGMGLTSRSPLPACNFHLFATFAAMLTTRTRRFSAAKGSLGFLSLLLP